MTPDPFSTQLTRQPGGLLSVGMRKKRMRLALAALLGVLGAGTAAAQPADSLPDRGKALVATSATFVFYSDPVTNLHDFLLWNARSREPVEPAPDCLAGLPAEQRTAFERARDHYKVFATPAGNRLLLALRFRLAGFGDFGIADAAAIDAALATLPPAAPAYEACWWRTHDARNRRWIAALEPLLAMHEKALNARLSELYGEALGRLPVDVVSHGSFSGADSVVNPDHLLVSSIDNVLRPLLISGGETRIPFLLVFFGVLGGLMSFGMLGLFLGPVVLAVAFALVVEFARRA